MFYAVPSGIQQPMLWQYCIITVQPQVLWLGMYGVHPSLAKMQDGLKAATSQSVVHQSINVTYSLLVLTLKNTFVS